jgi:outer membrane receptor protein involved in Fe transport
MKADRKLPCIQELSRSIAEVLSDARSGTAARASKAGRPTTILSASSGVLLGAALVVAPQHKAMAQEEESLVTEEVVVTGSRIPRRDFTANAPITTIDESIFEETNSIGVETVLNQLPQFVPAVTQFASFDVENTATNTVGASTVSLRGLGPNRNLVLINGRRAMPVNPTMVVDTNSIPASAIERVEVISGGASAVYGADAVGGVVNFILKDDFEGATVDMRIGDTQHGGGQEVSISGLIGVNLDGGRGNVLVGVERASRAEVLMQQRDWRVADAANPSIGGTQVFPTETWFSEAPGSFANNPSQAAVDAIFTDVPGQVPTNSRFYVNRTNDGSGTVFTGLNQGSTGVAGSYRYEGPFNVGNYGEFSGLPFRVEQPDGGLKENTWYQPASIPLDRLSAFARGHFEVADNIRLVGQAMFTRTDNRTRLGATSDTIGVWGAVVPFGTNIYEPSVVSFGDDGLPNTGDTNEDMTTLPAFQENGVHQLNCDPTGGCTETEAWPVPPEVEALMLSRPSPERDIRVNRTQDDLRFQLGDARGSNNYTNTMQLSLGVEGELPSGNDFWDITVSTGRTDSQNTLTGSIRLTTYRQLMASPNYGAGFVGDPNPFSTGFAEGIPTCTSGMPIVRLFNMSEDCVEMLHAPLQNQTNVDQTIFEANLVGDLMEMRAGPLGYALGLSHRENSYRYIPDNLIRNGSTADAIAGTFPNTISGGEFDVSEIYGELLIPIISDGPRGFEHFNIELGGRISDWSIAQVEQVETYKALIDWAITPNYRIRGGWNRAMRAPNLGELFIGRSQVFQSQPTLYGDQCSQNAGVGPFSANEAISGDAQAAHTLAICRELMGQTGAEEYYDLRDRTDQPTNTGFFVSAGTQNSFGNPNVYEEQADTFTLGVVMDFLEDWTLTVDYYTIEIKDMIAIESPDTVYQQCLSIDFNPTQDANSAACSRISRNQFTGGASNLDLTFTNQGRAEVAGVDLQLNWSKAMASGGFNLSVVANYNLKSEIQDRPELATIDYAGTRGCGLQIQCQQYDYRLFTTLNYFRDAWSITLRHQFWPSLLDATYAEGVLGTPNPLGSINDSYQSWYLGASYSFADKYTLRFGIENLLDEEPPLVGGDPDNARFPIPPSHLVVGGLANFGAGGSAVYEPLGRRGFVSMTMDF